MLNEQFTRRNCTDKSLCDSSSETSYELAKTYECRIIDRRPCLVDMTLTCNGTVQIFIVSCW